MTASTSRQICVHIHFTPPAGSLAARALAQEIMTGACLVALLPGGSESQIAPDHRLWIVTPGAPTTAELPGEPAPVVLHSPRVDPAPWRASRAVVALDYDDMGRTLAALSRFVPLEIRAMAVESAAQFRAQDAFERALCRPAGDLHGKIADYSRALDYHPYYAEALARRGGARIALGELEAGMGDCNEAIQIDPDLAEAYYNRARAHSRREDYQAAIADYSQAVERDPALVQAYLNRGAAHAYLREYTAAIADYTAALERDPALAEAHFNRSVAHAEAGDFESAMTDYSTALALNLSRGAESRPASGDAAQTIAYLERLLRRFPDHPAAGAIRAEIARLAALPR